MSDSEQGLAQRVVTARAGKALLIAAATAALAVVSPAAALAALAMLAARALMLGGSLRIDVQALAGPVFAALAVGAVCGVAAGIGVLFLWRVFSDTLWSARESALLARAMGRPGEHGILASAHMWATPLFGVAVVAYTAPHMVAGLPLDLPHVPVVVVQAAAALAVLGIGDWALRQAADWRLGELAAAPAAHAAAHHLIFLAAYGLTLDVSAGLVGVAAWRLAHAAPYRAARRRVYASFTAVP
jgi:hypothetical protein